MSADLLAAVKARDAAKVKEILAENPQLAASRGPAGESLILLAAYLGAQDIVQALGEHAPLDLFEASALGQGQRVRELLGGEPAGLLERSFDGWTALHLASFFGHLEVAVLLIEAGAPLDAAANNQEQNHPLHAALAGQRNPELVRLLLERGANARGCTAIGVTPLHLAASRGDRELVELLIAHGALASDRMDNGQTAADLARARNHPALAEWLETQTLPSPLRGESLA